LFAIKDGRGLSLSSFRNQLLKWNILNPNFIFHFVLLSSAASTTDKQTTINKLGCSDFNFFLTILIKINYKIRMAIKMEALCALKNGQQNGHFKHFYSLKDFN